MINIRRIYVYLVSAITLQAVTWATIALLRNLTVSQLTNPTSAIAAQIAMILVGLPLFLVHWLWAQRSAHSDPAERASLPRRFYLDGMLLAFIIPAFNSARLVVEAIVEKLLRPAATGPVWSTDILFSLIALLVTAVLAAYHVHIRGQDDEAITQDETNAFLDQLLIYLLVTGSLALTAFGVVALIRLLLGTASSAEIGIGSVRGQAESIALVLAGLPLWISSWRLAQRSFAAGAAQGQVILVRKLALYLIVFAAAFTAVSTTTILLANLLMRLLDVPSSGGGLNSAIATIIVSSTIWAYHARVLQRDAAAAKTAGQAAAVRRIYLYLVSGVGLTAVLIGTGGILSVLIRALDSAHLGTDLREQLAQFTAALIAGMPVWLLSWRRIQALVSAGSAAENEERSALVRRFYLYLFLFFAVLTLLGGAVYLVSQIVELLLGSRTTTRLLADMGQAIAYTLIAAAVLIYHRGLLRQDQEAINAQAIRERQALRIAVIDAGNGRLGSYLVEHLGRELPGAHIQPLPLTEAAREAMLPAAQESPATETLAAASVIVAPWQLAGKVRDGLIDPGILDAFNQSAAYKLVLPVPQKGMTWIGVEPWQEKEIARDVSDVISSIARGDQPSAARKLSAAAIAAIVLAALCSLTVFVPLVIQLIDIMLRD